MDGKDVAVPITPVRAKPEVFVMSSPQATIPTTSGPAEAQVPIATVQWPTPDEAQRKAEVAADPEMRKHVWERKGFDKLISKLTNDKGAQEFKDWAYELRRVTVKDDNFHEFLRWLEEAELEADKGNITESNLAAIGKLKSWNTAWLNDQLYGILAEATAIGSRAKGAVMAMELKKSIHGATVYRKFAREHLDGSQRAQVALGVKITKLMPSPMDEFEDRLRTYDQDLERYERLTKQTVGELVFVHLQEMIPTEAKQRFDNERHNFTKVAELREFFSRIIEDHKASGTKRKPKTLQELTAEIPNQDEGEGQDQPVDGGLLYSVPAYASDEDVGKISGPTEPLSFVKWRNRGGKGSGKFGPKGGTGGKGQPWGSNAEKGQTSSSGSAGGKGKGDFDGMCEFCKEYGHRKRDCKELDKVMAARRAAGTSPPRGFKGGGKAAGYTGIGGGGKGGPAFGLEFPGLDQPQMAPPNATPPGTQFAAPPGSQFGSFGGGPFAAQTQTTPLCGEEPPCLAQLFVA